MSHPKRVQKIERSAEKRAIEIARYVLPVAAFTTMVHTLSGIVLHRLWRMCAACDTPSEARAVIGEMVARVRDIDPQFFDRFGTEPIEEVPEWGDRQHRSARWPIHRSKRNRRHRRHASPANSTPSSAAKPRNSSTIPPNAPHVIAEAYRAVVGLTESQCTDAEAIDRLLNPARNLYRLETLNVGVHAPHHARARSTPITPSPKKSATPPTARTRPQCIRASVACRHLYRHEQ